MSEFLYITEQGAVVRKAGWNLVVECDGGTLYRYPAMQLKQIICIGSVGVTPAALSFCMSNDIGILFITRWGRLKGIIEGFAGKNAILRNCQYQAALNSDIRLRISKEIVKSKAMNYRRWLSNYLKYSNGIFYQQVKRFIKNCERINDLDRLRGYEGGFSRLYFSILPELLVEDFGFKGRVKHPPRDPLNVLLSFAYTLLFQTVYSVVRGLGLDPYRGFYHEISYGHPALVSDLMEEFRSVLADQLVVSLINRRKITETHFDRKDGKVRFSREGIAILVKEYSNNLLKKRSMKGKEVQMVQLIAEQVKKLCRVITGKSKDYEGFRLW